MDKWNDERLDELNRRVREVERNIADLPTVKAEMRTLTRELSHTKEAVKSLDDKLDESILEPLKKTKEFQNRLMIAILAAVAGGVVTVISALVGGGIH